jgi:hypothetical protein
MATLKDQINDISGDSRSLLKDYIKLFSIQQSERLALFLGIITSLYILSTIVLILVIFGSFFLAGSLNHLLNSEFWGYMIVGGVYMVVIGLLVVRMVRMKTPLFFSFFVKLVVTVLNIDLVETPDKQGIKLAEEKVRHRIDTNRIKIKSQVQLFRFTFLESLIKEFLGIFKFSKTSSKKENS